MPLTGHDCTTRYGASLHVKSSGWCFVLQGVNADPEGCGQAPQAGSAPSEGLSWAALADSALPQGPLLEVTASADAQVSHV